MTRCSKCGLDATTFDSSWVCEDCMSEQLLGDMPKRPRPWPSSDPGGCIHCYQPNNCPICRTSDQRWWEDMDMVNAPPHYNMHGFEVADILEAYFSDNPHLWNCGKYLLRSGYKGHEQQDIEKMIWYGKRYLKFKYGVNFDTDTVPDISSQQGDS